MAESQTSILEYKGYVGSIEADVDAGLLSGTVQGINDVIHYEAKSVPGLAKAFRASVNDYLAMCKKAGENPEKPYSGKFQARVGIELHRRAAAVAAAQNISLNDLVCRSLNSAVQ